MQNIAKFSKKKEAKVVKFALGKKRFKIFPILFFSKWSEERTLNFCVLVKKKKKTWVHRQGLFFSSNYSN
jgi:hypothetical protein